MKAPTRLDCVDEHQQYDEYVRWLLAHPDAIAYVYEDDRGRHAQLIAALGDDRIVRAINEDGEVV